MPRASRYLKNIDINIEEISISETFDLEMSIPAKDRR